MRGPVALPVGNRSIVGYYYGLLVYWNPSFGSSAFKTCDESVMKMTKETCLSFANRLPGTGTERNVVQRLVWRVSVSICSVLYVNDVRYFPEDKISVGEKTRKEQINDVAFYQTESPTIATSFMSFKLLASRTLQNMKHGKALFLAYGSKYEFHY